MCIRDRVISSELVGDQITVPSVAGMDEAEAQKKLEAEGLKVGPSEAVYSCLLSTYRCV